MYLERGLFDLCLLIENSKYFYAFWLQQEQYTLCNEANEFMTAAAYCYLFCFAMLSEGYPEYLFTSVSDVSPQEGTLLFFTFKTKNSLVLFCLEKMERFSGQVGV